MLPTCLIKFQSQMGGVMQVVVVAVAAIYILQSHGSFKSSLRVGGLLRVVRFKKKGTLRGSRVFHNKEV